MTNNQIKLIKLGLLIFAVVFLVICSTTSMHLMSAHYGHHGEYSNNLTGGHTTLMSLLRLAIPTILAALALTIFIIYKSISELYNKQKMQIKIKKTFIKIIRIKTFLTEILRAGILHPKIF